MGVVLIFIGAMDAMLSWRGGMAASQFYVLLLGSGLFLYALGAIRSRGSGADRSGARSGG
jgi:hypothetical protein